MTSCEPIVAKRARWPAHFAAAPRARISNDPQMPADLGALFAGAARPHAYIASPLRFSEAGRTYYVERSLPALREHVLPVDPWTLSLPEEFAAAATAGRERE